MELLVALFEVFGVLFVASTPVIVPSEEDSRDEDIDSIIGGKLTAGGDSSKSLRNG